MSEAEDRHVIEVLRFRGLTDAEIRDQYPQYAQYLPRPANPPDPNFDPAAYAEASARSEAALAKFQQQHGVSPEAYFGMSDLQRMQQDAVHTRDTNRDAVMAGFGDIQSGQDAATRYAQVTDAARLAGQGDLRDAAFGMDEDFFGGLGAATTTARDMDFATYGEARNQGALASQREGDALGTFSGMGRGANAADMANLDTLGIASGNANLRDRSALSGLTSAANSANAADRGSLSYLRGIESGIDPADPINYGEDLTSIAGRSTADPNAIASQRYADSLLQNYAGGSQDIGSAAARARADSQDIGAQRDVLGRLLGEAGADGIESRAGGVTADEDAIGMQLDAAGQYRDVAGGGSRINSTAAGASADPRAIAAQYDVLGQLEGRSGAGLTAVERAMMETARRNEERDRKASMDAQLRDLRARGVGGGGAEIGAMLGSQQMTSENRMLQDMLALASAQERSERAQSARAALAGDLRGQSFGESFDTGAAADAMALQNRNAEMAALGQYAGLGTTMRGMGFNEDMAAAEAGDEMALANREYGYGALTDAGELASGMRGQGFEEAFRTASAGDAMKVGNRDFRLDALGNSADLATTMRGQGFDEQFQAGGATDAMAQYNRSQSLDTQQYNAELQRQQNEDAWNRATGYTDRNLGANATAYGRNTDVYDEQRDVAGTEYGRAGDMYGAEQETISGMYGREGDIYGATTDSANRDFDRSMTLADQGYGVTDQNFNRASSLAGVGFGLVDSNYGRGLEYLDTLSQTGDNAYQRERDRQGNVVDMVGLYTGQGTRDGAAIQDAHSAQVGDNAAKAAQAALERSWQEQLVNPLGLGG